MFDKDLIFNQFDTFDEMVKAVSDTTLSLLIQKIQKEQKDREEKAKREHINKLMDTITEFLSKAENESGRIRIQGIPDCYSFSPIDLLKAVYDYYQNH